jgi:hypothetical protein
MPILDNGRWVSAATVVSHPVDPDEKKHFGDVDGQAWYLERVRDRSGRVVPLYGGGAG